MYVLALALRYLRRRRITFLGVTAVALGVFAFIVVVGVMEGFLVELRRRLRGALGDVVVIGGLQEVAFREQVTDLLRQDPRVKAMAPRLYGMGILRMRGRPTSPGLSPPGPSASLRVVSTSNHGEGSQATDAAASAGGGEAGAPGSQAGRPSADGTEMTAFKLVSVAGIVPEEEVGVTDFPRYLLDVTVAELAAWDEAKEGGPWLLAGEELVARPKVPVGAEVRLLVPRGLGEYDSFPFRLAGTFRTGIHEYDSQSVYVPLASVQWTRNARLVLRLADGVSPDGSTEPLQRELGRLAARFERSSSLRRRPDETPGLRQAQPTLSLPKGAGAGAGPEAPESPGTEVVPLPQSGGQPPGPAGARQPDAGGGPQSTGPAGAHEVGAGPEPPGAEPLPGPPWVLTSDEMNHNLLAAVRLQTRMASLVLIFYFLVAGVAVFAIMTMVVVEKTRDVGVIRAVGGSVRGVLGTFLLYGLATGVAGAATGVVAGRLTLSHLDWLRHQISVWTGWEPFPKELYMLDTLPWTFEPRLVLSVVAVALMTVLLSSLYPAWRGARLPPVETLRYE